MLSQMVGFPFSWLNIFHCMFMHACLPYLLYPFICGQVLRLFSCLGYSDKDALNMGVHICLFHFFGYIPGNGVTGYFGNSIFNFFNTLL